MREKKTSSWSSLRFYLTIKVTIKIWLSYSDSHGRRSRKPVEQSLEENCLRLITTCSLSKGKKQIRKRKSVKTTGIMSFLSKIWVKEDEKRRSASWHLSLSIYLSLSLLFMILMDVRICLRLVLIPAYRSGLIHLLTQVSRETRKMSVISYES